MLSAAKPWVTGLSTITGCNFDRKGNLYVGEMFANDVVKVPFSHPATGRTVIGTGALAFPNGVAVGGAHASSRRPVTHRAIPKQLGTRCCRLHPGVRSHVVVAFGTHVLGHSDVLVALSILVVDRARGGHDDGSRLGRTG